MSGPFDTDRFEFDTHEFGALEAELRAALAERADDITPTDRWQEITMATASTTRARRHWPVILLAAAAVLGVVAGVLVLRPDPRPTIPAGPSQGPTQSAPSTAPSASAPSPSSSGSVTPEADQVTPFEGTVPVYYIAPEALGWPESGLGLRRAWVPAETPADPQARAKAALVEALNRPTATEGQLRPWEGVSLVNVGVGTDRIDIALGEKPTADIAPNIAELAVQQLAWTAQAAVGKGNLPVFFAFPDGLATRIWDVDVTKGVIRPTRAEQYTVLTDLWITEPSYPEGGTSVVRAGTPLVVKGEASVFEANVQWQLVEGDGATGSGTVVDKGFVTASAGAPDRGTFEITVTLPATQGTYTLKVYAMSMKDGTSEVANDKLSLTVRSAGP